MMASLQDGRLPNNSATLCHIGLGSNLANELGAPIDHMYRAMEWLKAEPAFEDVVVSSLYVSKPFGVTDQADFINAVAKFTTSSAPCQVLDILQAMEQDAKRVRLRHWGERSLDLDLLTYGDEKIENERLIVPHQGLFQRGFVVIPMLEISPDIIIQGQKLADVYAKGDWQDVHPYLPSPHQI